MFFSRKTATRVLYTTASSRNQTTLRSIHIDTSFGLAHHPARTFQ